MGALTPGPFADLIAVDRDPVTVTATELTETLVHAYRLAGVAVA